MFNNNLEKKKRAVQDQFFFFYNHPNKPTLVYPFKKEKDLYIKEGSLAVGNKIKTKDSYLNYVKVRETRRKLK